MNMLTKRIKYLKLIFILGIIVFANSCNKEAFVESTAEEAVNGCKGYISSNPTGASIYVDGRNSGFKTPDTLKWLKEGVHKVLLKFNYVIDTTMDMNIKSTSTSSLYVDYFASPKNYGRIRCISSPLGASVFINDKLYSGFTPLLTSELFVGEYKVKCRYPGFRDDSTMVAVERGVTFRVEIALQDTGKWVDYWTANSNIGSNKIVASKVDSKNNIWFGSFDNGIYKFSKGKFITFNSSNSMLPYDFINCLEVDKDDKLWIGTYSGLAVFDGINWVVFKSGSSVLPSNNITAVYCDAERNIWIGTNKGLVRYSNGSMIAYTSNDSPLLQNSVSDITSTPKGDIWIASNGGVSTLSNGVWKAYSSKEYNFPGIEANAIASDQSGNIWCSFKENAPYNITGGLMIFDGINWREEILSNINKGKIQKIRIDSKGIKWIATSSGYKIIKLDGSQSFIGYGATAMHSFDIRDFGFDRSNNVWIATFGGGVTEWKNLYR